VDHARRASELLTGLGLEVELHPVPDALVRANGMVSATNLVVRRRFGEGGPTVALNAHGDVVPPGEGWRHDPYGAAVEDGWMYGRGVAVSKSDFATYAYALLALEDLAASGARSTARSNSTSPTTRRPAARSARAGCSSRGSASRTWRSAPASPTRS
jgi:acetylornithine deacetylase/succinyl-diaminopimelate desuccinylase-like protein